MHGKFLAIQMSGVDPKQWDGLLLTYCIKVPDWSFEKPVTRKKESGI